ncbi:hypothetical protein Mpal_1450 [Methanosphaerula palustris E1-9c]|uniref:Uncharacterized protein n=1 Tax=Methanosphaerula palustris (strain ATCC BAA-1556 / DSM 19958 / E1-9c) TaxID=521011 RepID=B8GI33_METPE|nr:hypothetical protein Mpal_1450 [Methanosphaerula palustris E1-9c]
MKFCKTRHFNIVMFLFFFLFASLFLFEFIMFTQPSLWLYLLILSFIGILGITGSLFYEKRRWMYAIPSVIVFLSFIINYIIMVQNSTSSRPSSVPATVSEVLYLSLPIVVTILHIGLYVSGLKHARSLALLTGALSIFPISSLFQDLIRIQNLLQGIPVLSSEDIVIFLYMLVTMPIIGVTILWEGYSLYQKRMIVTTLSPDSRSDW